MKTDSQSCICIGGTHDGMVTILKGGYFRIPVIPKMSKFKAFADEGAIFCDLEEYFLERIFFGGESLSFYRHEDLTPIKALEKVFIKYVEGTI